MWFLLILCLGLPLSLAINLICLHCTDCVSLCNIYIVVVIFNNFSFQPARCMLNFRDAGIKKQEPVCMAIITVTVDLMKKIRESNIPNQYFQSVQCCRWKG